MMVYKTDEIERCLDCAFGSDRNDKMRDWKWNACCGPTKLRLTMLWIFTPKFLIRDIRVIRGG